MKTLCRQSIGFLLILLLVAGSSPLLAQDQPVRDDADPEFITISGVVKDKNNKKRLEYVNHQRRRGILFQDKRRFPCESCRNIPYRIL